MRLPESIYSQDRSYKQGVLPRKVHASGDTSSSTSSISDVLFVVPSEYNLVIETACATIQAGEEQVVEFGGLYLLDENNSLHWLHIYEGSVERLLEVAWNFTGSVIVPEGWSVISSGQFDAFGNANSLSSFLTGNLIPSIF